MPKPAPRDSTPSIDEQVRELKAAGWKQYRFGIWVDPNGVMYRGPHGAWKELQRRKPDAI